MGRLNWSLRASGSGGQNGKLGLDAWKPTKAHAAARLSYSFTRPPPHAWPAGP